METAPLILLAAGGTGGHLFPAEALGVELIKRGLRVRLVTDARALRYSGLFSKDNIDVVPSETVRGRSPSRWPAPPSYYARWSRQSGAAAETRGRGRLWRLPDRAAADGRAPASVPGIIRDANAASASTASCRPASSRSRPRCPACSTRPGTRRRRPPSARRCGRRSRRRRRNHAPPEPNGPLRRCGRGSQGAGDETPCPARRKLEPTLWSWLDRHPASARGGHGVGARGL